MVIRDPVHGDIEITAPVISELIDTNAFQRLRRIKQLAGSELAFPGATHTRFTHSIGVYHLIQLVLKQPRFAAKFSDQAKLIVAVAGLLHDIGHGPYSHTFEQIQQINPLMQSHEKYAAQIIEDPHQQIAQILRKYFSPPEIKLICAIILGSTDHKFILAGLVSSQLDMDRVDYLLRDDRFAGTGYGYIDAQWIIRNMLIDEANQRIVFKAKCLYAIENYLVGRYHMYCQVYNHHISQGFNLLFQMIFQRLADLLAAGFPFQALDQTLLQQLLHQSSLTTPQYLAIDDCWMWSFWNQARKENDPILQTLIANFQNRSFFRPGNDLAQIKHYRQTIIKQYGLDASKYFLLTQQVSPPSFYDPHQHPIYLETSSGQTKNIYDCSALIQTYEANPKSEPITFIINPLF